MQTGKWDRNPHSIWTSRKIFFSFFYINIEVAGVNFNNNGPGPLYTHPYKKVKIPNIYLETHSNSKDNYIIPL